MKQTNDNKTNILNLIGVYHLDYGHFFKMSQINTIMSQNNTKLEPDQLKTRIFLLIFVF